MKNTVVWNDRLASQLPLSSGLSLPSNTTSVYYGHYPLTMKTQVFNRNTTRMHTFERKHLISTDTTRFWRYMPSILLWESPSESSAHCVGQ